ncbi:MAG: hypothetical protein ACE1ZN_04330, partial [Dehalococcoidia bacterium]
GSFGWSSEDDHLLSEQRVVIISLGWGRVAKSWRRRRSGRSWRGKKFPFSDLGETTMRGFDDRVHIYQVSWREA